MSLSLHEAEPSLGFLIFQYNIFLLGTPKLFWIRKWQPTPVFLPGESHGQRSLAVYTPWGGKESDMTEQLTHNTELLHPSSYLSLTGHETRIGQKIFTFTAEVEANGHSNNHWYLESVFIVDKNIISLHPEVDQMG